MSRFAFLRNRFGRGFFLFFIGTLGIAQGLNFIYTEFLTLVVGGIDTALGLTLMFSYVCVSTGKVYETPEALTAVGNGELRPAIGDSNSRDALVTAIPR